MAEVYLVRDLQHDREVALKVLRPDLAALLGPERFLREIRITAAMQHTNILPLLESGEAGGYLYYTMPYVAGDTLRELMLRRGPLPASEAVAIAADVADALQYAHALGIVHRDVKPENILLSSGHAVVADFGIARAVVAAGGERVSSAGLAIGTPAYISPEQAAGAAEIDGRADIYSLACVLFEMLAGEPPFTGPTPQAVLARHVSERTPSLAVLRPSIGAALTHAVEQALAKAPADRPATAAAFAGALRRALSDTTPAPLPAHRVTTRRWRIAAITGAVAALALLTWLLTARPWPLRAREGRERERRAAGQPATQLDPTHIAVLYFDDQSDGARLGHVAAGLTEDLIGELSQVPALQVISPDGVRPFRGEVVALDSIARRLDVGTVVAGSVAESPAGLRVSVRLVDAATGRQFAGQVFERRREELFLLRDEIAADVARNLRVRLGQEIALRTRRAGTRSVVAWELVRQAEAMREEALQPGERGEQGTTASQLLKADSLLAQAEARDPRWPEPVVLRGWLSHDQSGLPMEGSPVVGTSAGRRTDAWLRDGLRHADRALTMTPGYPPALELRGAILMRVSHLASTGLFPDLPDALARAEADLRVATASPSPLHARAWGLLSTVLETEGKYVEANHAAQRAYAADAYFRDASEIAFRLFYTSFELQREDDARRWCERGGRSFPDDWRFRMCQLYILVGFRSEPPNVPMAWRIGDELLRVAPAESRSWLGPRARLLAAAVVARAGLRDSALRVVRRARGEAPGDPQLDYYESLVRLVLGQRSESLTLLKSYIRHDPNDRRMVHQSTLFRSLRGDPQFEALTGP